VEGGKLENPEKNPRSKGENQQNQLTYDTEYENQTQGQICARRVSCRYATHASQY
jgi:hypothetical protein